MESDCERSEYLCGENKKICDVKIGDTVLTYSIDKEKISTAKVESCFEREVETIMSIETEEGDMLKLTEEHPIYIKNKGWIKAKNIKINDVVLKIR